MKPALALLFIALLVIGSVMAEDKPKEDSSAETAPVREKRQYGRGYGPRTFTETERIRGPGFRETIRITERGRR